MFYPKNISTKLGFEQIRALIVEQCSTDRGKTQAENMKCSILRDQVRLWLGQTNEMLEALSEGFGQFSLQIDIDLDSDMANAKGFFFETEKLVEIFDLLSSIKQVRDAFENKEDEYPLLSEMFSFPEYDNNLHQELDRILDPDGNLKPDASKELSKLSAAIQKMEKSLLQTSNKLFAQAKKGGILGDTEIGIKNGRMVLPVLAEHKKKVHGLLHDQSNTGKILYIEPLEMVELNNDLSELHLARRQEVIKILRSITALILPQLSELRRNIHQLSIFDFIRAKARVSLDNNWICPAIEQERHELWNARHPILEIRLKSEKKSVVPMDLQLDEDQRILVISGPNAGGKSVALKTVGLLQFMLQSGVPVPLNANSKMMHFDKIFVDIGDDQSIESDLSTYSSHLKAAKHMVNFSDENTLVLMDEIGTGTDPMFGGPMAEAILEALHDKKVYGVITTHFSNIKSRAAEMEHAVNGAMLFDTDKLEPQYKLMIGQAGSSFAYEVASNIGMNKKIIKRARSLTDTKQYDLDQLLAEVQLEKEELEEERKQLEEEKAKADYFAQEYKSLKEELDTNRKSLLKKAKQEAENIISSANKDIERTIREIKESSADKAKTKRLRENLSKKKDEVKEDRSQQAVSFKVGDRVRIIETDSVGEITEIKKNKAEVIIGSVKTKINLDRLEKVGASQKKKVTRYISNTSFAERQQDFSSELDIRGLRTEEALKKVEAWIDSAIILGFDRLRLIHGKGNGILKNQVRTMLKPNPAISKISYERVDLGGEGVSIIELA